MARDKRPNGAGGFRTKKDAAGNPIAWRGVKSIDGVRCYTKWYPSELAARLAMEVLQKPVPKVVAGPRHTLADAALAFMVEYGVGASTRADYEYALKKYVGEELTGKQIDQVTSEEISALYRGMADSGYALSTIKRTRAVVYGAFKYAKQHGWVTVDVARGLALPTAFVEEREGVEGFDDVDRAKLLTAMTGTRWEARHRLALELAMRPGEVTGLRWSRVDLAAGTVKIEGQLQRLRIEGDDAGAEVGPVWKNLPKTDAGHRTLKLGQRALAAMRAAKRQQELERAAFPLTPAQVAWREAGAARLAFAKARGHIARAAKYSVPPDDLCFTLPSGDPLLAATDTTLWKALCKKAGVEHRALYAARHTAISYLLRRGADPLSVSVMAGHRDLAFTARVYGDDLSARSHDLTAFFDEVEPGEFA
ncbi:site-specific integrase [Cryobacterium sp. N22]|uniref:tyrosine-type recombinase/integrase n=1 Tax=Cryobacterium sp. N22 TaxID=2048290 RepID=UPI000CE46015|nr:site-specific integrase [Cryobacterium sp. N22]